MKPSKRNRSTRLPVAEQRPSFSEPSKGDRLARRGSTALTDERPARRGSSDSSHESS
jgi:hypothetical protein